MGLKTERLILREFTLDDSHNLFKLFSEDSVAIYEAHLRINDVSDVENYITFHLENAKNLNRTHYYFAIQSQRCCEFLGMIGFACVEEVSINNSTGWVAEFEYYLLERYRNKGYMTEALKSLIEFAFESKNILKVFAQCHKGNTKSENVMIKCGMYKSATQPEPKLYNGVLKENVRYELMIENHGRV